MAKKNYLLAFFVLGLILSIYPANIYKASAASTKISVDPEVSSAPIGSTFTVNVEISDAHELFAWQFNMTWNSTLFWCSEATEGDFLSAWDTKPTYFLGADQINSSVGFAFVGSTITGADYGGTSGSGTLATLKFSVSGKGETMLNFTNIKLLDPAGTKLSFTTQTGLFINTAVPPVAAFSYTPSLPEIGDTIAFDASASYSPEEREITSYFWDFGDDTNGTGVTVTHSYAEAGLHTLRLTVTDALNLTNTKTVKLLVRYPHDVAVTGAETSKSEVNAGETVVLNATVFNKGTQTETFEVSFYYGDSLAGKNSVTNLAANYNATVSITWDTAGVPEGDYQIRAVAATVTGETSTADNTFLDGTVTVKPASQTSIPIELIVGIVAIVVVIVLVLLFMRRRRSSS